MKSIYYCSSEEHRQNTKIPMRVLKDDNACMEEIARIMFDTISARRDSEVMIICPVGPILQYPIFADIVNHEKLSLKKCTFINMDEYLDDDGSLISSQNSLSFRKAMNDSLYSKIDPELIMDENRRIFPQPGKEAEIDELICKFGGADLCLTGVGINGHIAFNEPPQMHEKITDEEYMSIGTRVLAISPETITNNGSRKLKGALDLFPKKCITLGMKQILTSKVLKVYLYCDWQWGIMRKITLGDTTRFAPASYMQQHKNSEVIISEALFNTTL